MTILRSTAGGKTLAVLFWHNEHEAVCPEDYPS